MRYWVTWGDQRFRLGQRASRGLRPKRWLPRRAMSFALTWGCKVLNVWYAPHRGIKPLDLVTFSRGRIVSVEYFPTWEDLMRKKNLGAAAPAGGSSHLAPMESNVLGKLHQLIAHCAVTRYDDGDPRRPGWFTVKTLGAAWVVDVKDPDACARLTATADSLDNALVLADMLLGAEEAPWEPDPFLKRLGGKAK